MILGFKSDSTPFFVGVGKAREVSVAAPTTDYIFELVDNLGQFKKMTKGEIVLLNDLKVMVKGFKTDDGIKEYIINEMSKLGMVFRREISLEEYGLFIKDLQGGT